MVRSYGIPIFEPGYRVFLQRLHLLPGELRSPCVPRSLIRAITNHPSVAKNTQRLQKKVKTEQPARMHMLNRVFAGHTCNLKGNAVPAS